MFIRIYFSVLALFIGTAVFGQFSPGLELDCGFLTEQKLNKTSVSDYNKNETRTYYSVYNELNPTWVGVSIRNFGSQFTSKNKNSIGYSLGIGYRQFSTISRLAFAGSSTTYRDSIVSRLHGAKFRTKYQMLTMDHYFDFHWNATETLKITNSIGFNLSTIIRITSPKTNINQSAINGELPLFKLFYQLQVTEKYQRCSVSYFALFDLYSLELFKSTINEFHAKSDNTRFSSLHFNAIGLRIMPHLKRAKSVDPNELF